ncbi:cupin domain-containing protein [Alphaproteobacteria bacterium]|nr:cupin domain-containing protein [Alphaproteobacteria bacterium]
MSTKQKFNVSVAENASYKDGLRDFLEYRDLGISEASNGDYKAHILRVKKNFKGDQEMHTTGFHKHMVDFQMYYVLNGWVKFIYDGEGELTFKKGDCVMAPAAIKHNELSCSDDFEALEMLSPAKHDTVKV